MSINIKKCKEKTIDSNTLSVYDFNIAMKCFNLWLSEHIVEEDLCDMEGGILQGAFLSGFTSYHAQCLQEDWIKKVEDNFVVKG